VSKCKLVTNRGKAVTMLYGTGGEAQEEVPRGSKFWSCEDPK
jgi:hypothetical protein